MGTEVAEEQVPPRRLDDWAARAMEPMGLVPAAHHRLLLHHLGRVSDGAIDRLLVLMPPGSAKSTYASQVFPAWWFHRHPASQVIAASHTQELATHFGRAVRNLAAEHAEWLGYSIRRDNHAAHRFETSQRGGYFATGLGGAITGRRADLVLIDDPVKSYMEAEGELHREAAWNWYRAELLPRLKPGGRVVMIMTRWHMDDLGGRVLAHDDGWTVLRLPAYAEAEDPLGRRPGAALWPDWEDKEALERKRLSLGERVWNAQYQQRPMAAGGALFRTGQIGVIDALPADIRTVRAWDLAASAAVDGRDPDWTAGVRLGRDGQGRFIVTDVVRFRGGPHEVAERLLGTARLDGPDVAIGLPQDPGQAGKMQVAWLSGVLAGFRVLASPETGAKITRAQPVAAHIEAGNVALLRAGWNAAFVAELAEFPHGRKDDQVDATSRAYAMLADAPAVKGRRLEMSFLAR
ncbi:MAG: phage terminase large subunit [Alphaproteobacteria bacterium]|nr:phage terminase large subunit [Alphaproteobacteria bacterium]